jgi:hypothetical protein
MRQIGAFVGICARRSIENAERQLCVCNLWAAAPGSTILSGLVDDAIMDNFRARPPVDVSSPELKAFFTLLVASMLSENSDLLSC